MGDDDATGVAPTELAAPIDATEAHTAWSLDDYEEPPPRLTPARITALAVTAALALVAVAGVLYVIHSRPVLGVVAAVKVSSEPSSSKALPAMGETGFDVPPPPPSTVTVTADPPMNYDVQMVNNLRRQGWSIGDPAQAGVGGRQVCTLLRSGQSVGQVMSQYAAEAQANGERYPYALADQFVHTAMATYPNCP